MPDQPDFMNAGSNLVQNLLPRTAQSYAPFPSISPASSALTARCQGAYAMQDNAGNVRLFAGDSTKLYRMDPASTTPANVSKVGGYSTGSTERIEMTLFGQRIISTNFADPPQSYIEGSSSIFADMITSGITTLRARHIAVVRDWIFLGNTTDGTSGTQPQRVWWCAIDDPTNFPTPGTPTAAAAQSDYQDLVGDAGWVQGILGNLGTADCAVFQERAVVRGVYVGPPAIFSFSTAEGVRGTPAPGSITQLSNIGYYLGEDGFYAFDGSTSRPIGFQKIDKTFFADLDQSYFYRITSTVDPINKIVYWAYPGAGHSMGDPNRILAYHWALDRWTITAANAIQLEVMLRALSFGYTLEQLDNVDSNLDTLMPSLDSRVWTGGRSVLACFDTSHQLNYFTGPNLAPTAQTSEQQINPKGRAQIINARPLVDGGTPSVSVGTRNRVGDAVTYTTPVAMDVNGNCYQRAEGRYFRGQVTLPAGSSFTHLQGIEVPDDEITNTGATR
jgi:hypothetical protein